MLLHGEEPAHPAGQNQQPLLLFPHPQAKAMPGTIAALVQGGTSLAVNSAVILPFPPCQGAQAGGKDLSGAKHQQGKKAALHLMPGHCTLPSEAPALPS